MVTSGRGTLALVLALGGAVSCRSEPSDATETASTTDATSETAAESAASTTAAAPAETGDSSGGPGRDDAGGAGTGIDLPDDAETWDVRADGFEVPAQETTYRCFPLSVPIDQLAHMIAFEPIVDDTTVVHHMLLYQALGPISPDDPCYPGPEPLSVVRWGWAPGIEPLQMPDDVGFLVGQTGAEAYFAVQIHYNNPLLEQGHIDSSGVRIYWTEQLRPNDAAVIAVGDVPSLLIPPQDPAFEVVLHCPSELTSQLMSEPSQVFGSWLHAHELGKSLWTEHIRDGQVIGELGRHDPYDFDAQHVEPLDAQLRPGDHLTTHCVYDSTGRDTWTIGGGDTDQEMCLNYLWIHPPQPNMGLCNQF